MEPCAEGYPALRAGGEVVQHRVSVEERKKCSSIGRRGMGYLVLASVRRGEEERGTVVAIGVTHCGLV